MIDYLSNLKNTSVGNFFKSAAGNIGSLFSSTTDKLGGFLGFGDSYEGPKIPKSKGADKATEYFGSYGEYAKRGAKGMERYGSYQQYAMPPIETKGFNAFDKIKEGFFSTGKKIVGRFTDPTSNILDKIGQTAKDFPTARGKRTISGLDASSLTPGFGFAPRANRRDAFRNDQLAQAAIQAALANVKIQRTMLTAIKGTAPTITLAGAGKIAVKRKVV